MKVLKSGTGKPWNIKASCSNSTCNALLLVEQDDVFVVNNIYETEFASKTFETYAFMCSECGSPTTIKSVPMHVVMLAKVKKREFHP